MWEETNLFIEILAPEEVPGGDLRMDTDTLYRAILTTDIFPAGWTDGFDMPSIGHDVDVLRSVPPRSAVPWTTRTGSARPSARTGSWRALSGTIRKSWPMPS